jgi:iron complex outermembrane recepter protein
MFKKSKIASGVLVALGGALVVGAMPALAQTATPPAQRIEITGSSIKRLDAETALPITVIKREDIERSGFTTAADLIQSLPSMQGFITASKSVNGGGGGVTTASLHSLGSAYTLVLLNGRRLAPYNTGTTVNLNSIPLSIVERIEVLTDGASAIYGADAIAGVVNFILKKNSEAGDFSISANLPQKSGGRSANLAISKGFGNFDSDGFNVLIGFSYEKQQELNAEQRSFSKSGFIPFESDGKQVTTWFSSSNSIPGTVILTDSTGNGDGDAFYSPDYLKTGKCGPRSVFRGGVCRFDFSSTVQNIPDSERLSLFGSARFKLAESATLFGEFGFSDYKTNPRFAPPAQPGIFMTQALVDKHVTPYLAQLGVKAGDFYPVGDPGFQGPSINLRVYDAGGRTNEFRTKTLHVVAGAEGNFGPVDFSTYLTHSENKATDTLKAGYLSSNKFNALIASGAFDPLSAQIGQSAAVLDPAVLRQLFDTTKSTLDIASVKGSIPLFKLGGGDFSVGLGIDIGRQGYKDDPSAISQGPNKLQPNFTDTPIGGSSGALPFDSTRGTVGTYMELAAPVLKELELAAAVRFDSFEAVKNSKNFDPDGNPIAAATQGKKASDTTYKFSARYQPVPEVLLRGSVGTGFKAPTLANITSPVQSAGSSGFHDCPPGLAPNLALFCAKVSQEYNKQSGGNPNTDASGLRPEKSQQWTVGFRIEPDRAFSFGVDLWQVKLKDRIDTVPEDVAFGDGVAYGQLFSVLPDPVTKKPTLTYTQSPTNLGKAQYMGLDFDVSSTVATPIGKLFGRGTLTYMIQSKYEVVGLDGYQTSLGRIGPDTEVTFRWLANLSVSLESGPMTNTFNIALKPGYQDASSTATSGSEVRLVRADGSIGGRVGVDRKVEAYTLFDWQGKYQITKEFAITGGIKNIFDKNPPFTIQNLDGTGNMRGYDGRYADPLGRQFSLTASYKF